MDSLVYGLIQVTNYRSEVWLTILNKFVYLASIIFLWSIIGKTVNGIAGVTSLVSYFLIANGVQGLVDGESLRYSKVINSEVKMGGLSTHLLRPINPVLFLYFTFLGTRGMTLLMTIILMVVGFIFLPSITFWQIILFLISLMMAFIVGFVFNLLVGSLSFWTPEANHLQNVFSHVIRVFSGVLIPISFFSGNMKTILLLSPFPSMAYLPSIIMQNQNMTVDMWLIFGASIFWSVLLLPLGFLFWKKGLRRYEAIGI